jgi:hypothetical protein
MKKHSVFLAMAALAVLSFALIGCDDGDDETFTPPGEEAKVNPLITEYLAGLDNTSALYKTIDLTNGTGSYEVPKGYASQEGLTTDPEYGNWQDKQGITYANGKFTAGDIVAISVSGTAKKNIDKMGFCIVDTDASVQYWKLLTEDGDPGWLFFDASDVSNPSGLKANTEFAGSKVFLITNNATNTNDTSNMVAINVDGDGTLTDVPAFYAFTIKVYKLTAGQKAEIDAL